MKTVRWIAIVLVLCILAAVLLACGKTSADGEEPNGQKETKGQETQSGETDGEAETEPEDPLLTLEKRSFSKETVTILCRDDKQYEISVDEPDGDIVSDAVYARNNRVEEYLDVSIEMIPVAGTWDEQNVFLNKVKNSVYAEDGEFDLIAAYMAYGTQLGMDGYLADLSDVHSLNLNNKWWTQGFVSQNTIGNSIFFALGDISLTMWESIYALFYNKEMAENYGVENMYRLVDNQEWTMEKWIEIVDLVTNESEEYGEGVYGLSVNSHSVRAFVTTCGLPICQRNEEGTYDLVYYSERLINLYDMVYEFVNDKSHVFFSKPYPDSDYTEMLQMFTGEQAMFMSGTLDVSPTIRGMKTNYGILPFPKYDEEQEDYRSHAYDGLSIFGIPASTTREDLVGYVLEALCAESYHSVVPSFYEEVMEYKVTRDADSIRMLEILRQKLYFDFGFVHAVPIGGLFQIFGDQIKAENRGFTSYYEGNESKYTEGLADVLEAYAEIG
ncbi:MAG: hypothetical protein IJU20_02945 [Clostridia bacterium]|nr:hypothetical protein [Clostridia bacterium]